MKTNQVVLVLALAVASSVATAGLVGNIPVTLDLQGRSAFGVMKTARFSDNRFEAIGCGVRATLLADGSLFRTGFCQVTTAENVFFLCFTENHALIDRIADGNDFSFITFRWNENDECTHVGFSTQSQYIPDKKGT